MRLAVEHFDVVDIQQGGAAIAAAARFALYVLDLAADIDAAHGFVLHHLVGAAFGDPFAEIHGDDAVGERRDALDAVIDQAARHGPRRASVRIRSENFLISAGRQAGERLVDQHDFGIARDRFRELHPAQIGERQRPGMPLQNAAQANLLGDGCGRAPPPKLRSPAAAANPAAAPA